jgi:F-type H+-transporting ATPase subunit b
VSADVLARHEDIRGRAVLSAAVAMRRRSRPRIALAIAAGMLTAVLTIAPDHAVSPLSSGVASLVARAAADDTSGGAHEGPHEGSDEAGEHAPSLDLKRLALQFLNFGVLLFILIKFGGAAINKALAARHRQLKADLSAAAELHAAAEAKLAKQEARLVSLEQEIAAMRLGFKAEAEAEKAQLIAAAEERAARIKAETAFLMEQQVREAEQRLRRESADAALTLAGEILRRSMGAPDQQRFLDTFVADVEQAPVAVGSPNGNPNGSGNGNSNGKEQAPPVAGRKSTPPDAEGMT